jgi:pimeloyl-ACP methyl ester carboxylesterase
MANAHQLVGSGEHPVIALNGWFGHAGGWGPMVNHIDTSRYTWAFMDQRGYGQLRNEPGPYSIERIAQDAVALANQLNWDRFSLVGHSMGGSAAQKVLALAPERVRALVGITPVPASGVPFDSEGWAFFSAAANDRATRKAIIDLTTGNRLCNTWLNAMVEDSMTHSHVHAFAEYLQAWANTDFLAEVQGKTTPVLVIPGEHDPALGPTTMAQTWMKHYPNITMETMANAGHYPMFETPIALITSIERFLSAH